MSAVDSSTGATVYLRKALKELSSNPSEGYYVGLANGSDLFEWSIVIIGPPDTP